MHVSQLSTQTVASYLHNFCIAGSTTDCKAGHQHSKQQARAWIPTARLLTDLYPNKATEPKLMLAKSPTKIGANHSCIFELSCKH